MLIKDILRGTIGSGGKHIGSVVRRLDQSLTIFLFHDVSDEPAPFAKENNLCVSTELFRRQMEFISSNFNIISMERMLNGNVPSRAAMITFDDGYAGTFKNALPILNTMRLPCTLFLNMAPIFGETFWAARVIYLSKKVKTFADFLQRRGQIPANRAHLECTQEHIDLYELEEGDDYLSEIANYVGPFASFEDLKESDANPMVTLGNHLFNHFNVKNLSNRVLKEQFEKNSIALSKFKRYIPVFAFPFGDPANGFSLDQAAFLLKNGAIRLFTTWSEPNNDHSARILNRIAFNSWHDRDSRFWYQIVKLPILEMFGSAGPQWCEQLKEIKS